MGLREVTKPALTPREEQIAALVAEGLTNREIAGRLCISERTADRHLEHIRQKLGVNSRARIASWYVEQSHSPAVAQPTQAPALRRRVWVGKRVLGLTVAGVAILALSAAAVVHFVSGTAHGPGYGIRLVPIAAGGFPVGMASSGKALWVADANNETLSQIDSQADRVISTVGTPGVPGSVVFQAPYVWITLPISSPDGVGVGAVARFDPRSRSWRVVPLGISSAITGIAKGPDGAIWAVSKNQDGVYPIDPGTMEPGPVLTVDAGSGPEAVAVDANGVWVANELGESVVRIDPQTGKVILRIGLSGNPPTALALAFGSIWVVSMNGRQLTRLDPSGTVQATIALDAGPTVIAVDSRWIWVSCQLGGRVDRIDPQTNKAIGIVVGGHPDSILATNGVVWVALGSL